MDSRPHYSHRSPGDVPPNKNLILGAIVVVGIICFAVWYGGTSNQPPGWSAPAVAARVNQAEQQRLSETRDILGEAIAEAAQLEYKGFEVSDWAPELEGRIRTALASNSDAHLAVAFMEATRTICEHGGDPNNLIGRWNALPATEDFTPRENCQEKGRLHAEAQELRQLHYAKKLVVRLVRDNSPDQLQESGWMAAALCDIKSADGMAELTAVLNARFMTASGPEAAMLGNLVANHWYDDVPEAAYALSFGDRRWGEN